MPYTLMSMRTFYMLPLLLLLAPAAQAQSDHGFRFVRIQYADDAQNWVSRFGDTWAHDYPTAELNFYEALERTTRVHLEGPPLVLTLKDKRIFEYPLLYLCEPGYWNLEEEERNNLAQYLKRGGFILFDDFRGDAEWVHFYLTMKSVLPDAEPQEIPPDHPVWNIYYDIDPVEAPSNVSGGFRGGFSKFDDRYMAFFDADGRMVALACHNQDIGDGWEWPSRNFENVSTVSFQMGVNFLIYALTH